MNLEEYLSMVPRSEQDYCLISEHRKYQHDEQFYDEQYQISPYDYVAGKGLSNLAQRLALDVNSPILELGCGTGRLSVGLLAAFGSAKVFVTDASSIFLDISKKKFLENKLELPTLGVLKFEDMSKLPDESFSLIVIRSALHHIEKYDDFLVTAAEKIVRGGALIFQEPLYEGLFVMGLIAKFLQKQADDAGVLKDLKMLADTMCFYCRDDVDKSDAEDKYAFRLNDILNAANKAKLSVQFFPNRAFEDFAGEPSQFDYMQFVQSYLKYCMGFGEKTVEFFMRNAADVLGYIAEISGADRAPESSGVFVLAKPR